ncbi:hypothetical protein [Nitrosomonas sp. ANs5]|uniref:hypothetical protein n=1 Tax=Nitrosomonas sp. ANs5 TaxID=3423941 RepID=UPI003D3370BC
MTTEAKGAFYAPRYGEVMHKWLFEKQNESGFIALSIASSSVNPIGDTMNRDYAFTFPIIV